MAFSASLHDGDSAFQSGDFPKAIDSYLKALSSTSSDLEKGEVARKLSMVHLRDHSSADKDDVQAAATYGRTAALLAPSADAHHQHARALRSTAIHMSSLSVSSQSDALQVIAAAVAATDEGLILEPGHAALASLRAELKSMPTTFGKLQASCIRCNKPSEHRCGRCGRATYCSAACQRAHWALHKSSCVAPSRPITTPGGTSGSASSTSSSVKVPFSASETHGFYPSSPTRSRLISDASIADTIERCVHAAKQSLREGSAKEVALAQSSEATRLNAGGPIGPEAMRSSKLMHLFMQDPFVGATVFIAAGLNPNLQTAVFCPTHCRMEKMSFIAHAGCAARRRRSCRPAAGRGRLR